MNEQPKDATETPTEEIAVPEKITAPVTEKFAAPVDDYLEQVEELVEDGMTFAELLEAHDKTPKEGEVMKGLVITIFNDVVTIDIGYKSEGQVPLAEFADESGEITVQVGDEVDVLLEQQEDEDGAIVLSKEKADRMKIWDDISDAFNADGIVEGRIVSRVKGGLAVDIGVRAFLPGSQVDLRPVRNLEKLIGESFKFKILKFNKRRGNIVLSRRALLEKEREALRTTTLDKLKVGARLPGIVKNITDYGAFIDLGGIDGLLHITDMSWGRVNHPSEMFEVGDEVEVMVLKYDPERQRVSLGLKQCTPDPWTDVSSKYQVSDKVKGRVVSLTDYGAFVELEAGVEGLVHVSEMSWTKKIKHPNKLLAVGDVIETVVLDIDVENRRISLGLKQTEPNPWEIVEERYPVGTRIIGKIRNITDFGVFVGIDEGIDGLIHISDISWTQRIKHPGELFKKSQEVEAIVLNIDRDNERFSLGIKQLTDDPWSKVPERYRIGDIVTGEVLNITDFGIFVYLEEGIEGLIHVSELSSKKVKNPSEFAAVSDKITAEIISIDTRERRIRLSVKSIEENTEKADYAAFVTKQGPAKAVIGDLIQKAAGEDEEAVEGEAAEVAEAPAEEVVAEKTAAVAEEVVAEEPAAEEAPVEEAPAEEAVVEEPVAVAEEAPAEEAVVEEPVAEAAEEATEGEGEPEKTDE
jgi:small subunit ribosomal protein S1